MLRSDEPVPASRPHPTSSGRPRAPTRGSQAEWRLRSVPLLTAFLLVGPILGPVLGGCTVRWQRVEAEEVDPSRTPQMISTPVRAYLADGSIVVLPAGADVLQDRLQGQGTRHSLELDSREQFQSVALDSVVAMEAFHERNERETATVLLAAASAAATAVGSLALYKAIFGSCPTIYAEVDGETTLQAEPFSYSITALFEARDVDRLSVRPAPLGSDGRGIVRLELRNEALETHYINHMELLEVAHGPGEEVVSDPSGRPMVVGDLRAPLSAVDRSGRDVLQEITHGDGRAFRSSRERLTAASKDDFTDYVELELPTGSHEGEVALVFRVRNTLLNSVLFYDVMLGGSGLRALDWLGSDLQRIGPAVELASWYQNRMGMKVEVERNGVFEQVEYLPDAGPIAWTERVVVIPVAGERPRVRLKFPSDSWFIDRIAVAARAVRPGEVRRIPLTRVLDATGRADPAGPALLRAPDEEYLVTFPGQRMYLEFEVSPEEGASRTFLLATQGYYVEWLRGDWLRAEADPHPFSPEDGAILRAMDHWAAVMHEYEQDFHASRIPVR